MVYHNIFRPFLQSSFKIFKSEYEIWVVCAIKLSGIIYLFDVLKAQLFALDYFVQ
jgi:hypothetical protein